MANIKALVVAGGGGGGTSGGGAGGYIYDSSHSVSLTSYTVTIGAGGTVPNLASPTSGANSTFDNLTAIGGGHGGWAQNAAPEVGGSGGGGGKDFSSGVGAAGTSGQGNAGGNVGDNKTTGAGGGGANAVGANVSGASTCGAGGDGIADSSVGNLLSLSTSGVDSGGIRYIAGGGGGGGETGSTLGAGGKGGGGGGAIEGTGSAGTANTGGGGGGSQRSGGYCYGGTGGTGVVILSWPTSTFGICSITGTGNSITTNGSDSIAKFIIDGTITFTEAVTGSSNFFNFF